MTRSTGTKRPRRRGLLGALKRLRRRMGREAYRLRYTRQVPARDGLKPTQLQGHWRLCWVNTSRSTSEIKDENLALAVRALTDAGVPFVALPSSSHDRHRVGVPVEQRARAIAAMARTWADSPVYLRARGQAQLAGTARLDRYGCEDLPTLRIFQYHVTPESSFLADHRLGCDVEFYVQEGDTLRFKPGNRVTEGLPEALATRSSVSLGGQDLPTFQPLWDRTPAHEIGFPIDVVYTWVDGDDPAWAARRAAYLPVAGRSEEAAGAARYLSRDELRYSLRSLHQFADWVNHIYVVTDGQSPPWLGEHPRLTIVDHTEIFDDPEKLPVFNSHAIESQLHHIPGLSEHYLYLNDDVYFGRRVSPDHFFHANGLAKMFLSHHKIDLGPPCPDDPPIMSAAKNGRRMIEDHFGRTITRKICHAPHPQRRSVVYEMEERMAEEFGRVSRSRFRAMTDISVASSLHHHYGFQVGTSVPDTLRYSYIDSQHEGLAEHLRRLERRRYHEAFCINDTDATRGQLDRVTPLLRGFLDSYFPIPSPFERSRDEASRLSRQQHDVVRAS